MYKSSLGKAFRVYCSKGCKDHDSFLFGAQVYHETSSICKAAIQDGKISNDKGGEFLVIHVPHDKLFESQNANGVTSTAMQVETQVTAFALEKAPKIIDVECNTLANDEKLFQNFSGMIYVNCPAHCSKKPHTVFNQKDTYWFGSSVC